MQYLIISGEKGAPCKKVVKTKYKNILQPEVPKLVIQNEAATNSEENTKIFQAKRSPETPI